jgi:hypothetical protein
MPCCILAAAFIAVFVVRWRGVARYLGFEFDDRNVYGWEEHCELDEFSS